MALLLQDIVYIQVQVKLALKLNGYSKQPVRDNWLLRF